MSTRKTRSIPDRVAFGARALDRARPGWAAEIEADELAMDSCTQCILGQLYGHYIAGYYSVSRCLSTSRRWHAAALGFSACRQRDLTEFNALADAWRAQIRARIGAPEPEARP